MRWLVVVEHEVNDVSRRADEQDFESRVVKGVRESPEQICNRSPSESYAYIIEC